MLVDCDCLTRVLGEYLWEPEEGTQILRCKGILKGVCKEDMENGKEVAKVYSMQGVGDVFEIRKIDENLDKVPNVKLLFVGRGIDPKEIEDKIRRECFRQIKCGN